MNSINPISFQQMRPEKQRKVATIRRHGIYEKMSKQKLGEYYIKFIRPKGDKGNDIVDGDRHE